MEMAMGKIYYYLYVFSIDIYGKHNLICGKLFFDYGQAMDELNKFCDMPGNHAQIVNGNTVLYER